MPIIDLTQSPTAPNADKEIKDAIAQLIANEKNDDEVAAALETLVKAKDAAHDNAIADLKLNDATTDAALKVLSNKITALETKTVPAQVIKSSGPPPDGDWLLALETRKTATKRTTRLWAQVETGIAKPLLVLEDPLTTPTHSTAIAQPDGSYRQDLGDLKLSYRTTLNAQNEGSMAMTFPSGLITRVDLEGQDAQGTALELGGQAIAPGATNVTLNPFMGNALVTQILFKIAFSDSSVTQYLIPLTR